MMARFNQEFRSSGKFVAMRQAQGQARELTCRLRSGLGLVKVNRVRHSPVIAGQVYNENNKQIRHQDGKTIQGLESR